METNEFNEMLNFLLIKTNDTILLLSSKIQKLIQRYKRLKQLIQQTADSTQYEKLLGSTKSEIKNLEISAKELNTIKKSLSDLYIYVQGLINENLERTQLQRELEDINLRLYSSQLDEIGKIVN